METFEPNARVDRRIFIQGLGWVSTALVLATMTGGCESLLRRIRNRPVRRRLRTGSAEVDQALAIYKDAVALMKGLPNSDPRSWNAQAALHGTAVPNVFNFCQHGTNHFFSWHRAYLFYFERICQTLTGEKKFGLPYWNWNQDPAMHPDFLVNPLSHPRVNTSVAGNAAFSNATLNAIFGDDNFFTFSSQIEGSPHNTAHVVIGADMVTGGSPQDPVFWAHHCMVDYCWAKWNLELDNDNTNDGGWNGTSWNHFVDGDGDPVTVTAGATVLMPLLSYRYESSAIGAFPAEAALSSADFRKLEDRVRKGADVRLEVKRRIRIAERAAVPLVRPFSQETRVSPNDFAALVESDAAAERIFATIQHAQLPPVNDFFVRVFLNLPTATADTPTEDPHFAGSFAFFGTHHEGHEGHHPKTEFLVNVTDTLQRLRRTGQLPGGTPLSIQLVAVPVTPGLLAQPLAELQLENIDLVVSPIRVRAR